LNDGNDGVPTREEPEMKTLSAQAERSGSCAGLKSAECEAEISQKLAVIGAHKNSSVPLLLKQEKAVIGARTGVA
jgi:hypothetical protein